MTASRLTEDRSPGHGIDRDSPLSFIVDGYEVSGFAGDTVASALLGSDRVACGRSMYLSRPRGILTAGVAEPNALLHVSPQQRDGPAESMLPATTVLACDGLEAHWLQGLGSLDPGGDNAIYDHKHVHTDVLVIGAGPAGIAAAHEAAETGARTMLVDEQSLPGGSLLETRSGGESGDIDGQASTAWAHTTIERLQTQEEFTYLPHTTAIGSYDSNYIVAVEQRMAHLPADERERLVAAGISRQRVWHVRAGRVVLATGAHERPVVFSNNDRPGIMLASAVRSYLNRYSVAAGSHIVVFTTNDSAYALVEDLIAAGIRVASVIDSRPEPSPRAATVLGATAVRGIPGSAVVDTAATTNGRLTAVSVSTLDADGRPVGEVEVLSTDLLAVSGGLSPVLHLHTQRQGGVRWDEEQAGFVPEQPVKRQFVAGSANGAGDLVTVREEGARAGHLAAEQLGYSAPPPEPTAETTVPSAPARPLWLVPAPGGGETSTDADHWRAHFVDLQRDQTVADVLRATGAGMRSVEHVKRYTSISTANDQGKTSSVNVMGVIASLLNQHDLATVGTTANRAPYTPVPFVALAGRRRGELFDAARVTNIHPWHVEHGALFEDVGQWKRPRYYPRGAEDMDAAVLRECAAVRDSVGFQDASTLGKIEIRGADAPELLNRVYTNGFAKLKVGAGRYGLMCTPDGMLFDDGVTMRLAEDRYFMTTTTGAAAKVLDWLEEWHQTEWPELDVCFTSVTEQYNVVAVAGPRSRAVVAKIAPDIDVSNEAFPFMTFRETTLANGLPARIARVSFSGELAFEVSVDSFYGLAAWESIAEAGAEFDITPYGTETMHVLRAEKGLIIIGQDTDGTVTPQDAGMGWAISKLKDFIGKRSYSRADNLRENRKHLVGVLPVDRETRLDEGAQLIAAGTPITPEKAPVPMIGHVTSSYLSAALGRPFGLALVESGRNRFGEIVQSSQGGELVDVEITSAILVDPEGSRRDG